MTNSAWSQAWSSVRAHRGSMGGPFLVLALAGALISATGVLMESGLRADPADPGAGLLTALSGSFGGTALLVVVLVVAATVTLAMRQRRRELALLRAIGATRAQVRRRIATELALLTALAAPLGAVPGLWLARSSHPLLEDAGIGGDVPLRLSPVPVVVAVALLVPLSVLAARLAVRETLRLAPTAALRSSAAEERTIGPVRRILASATAVAGLLAAGTPLVVPGALGSATAASSALLLVAAAALAGPILVTWVLDRLGGALSGLRHPAARLALANSRGFSRRLATAVVPLAAALALGTIQSSSNSVISAGAEKQLREGIHADRVVFDPDGISDARLDDLTGTAGVTRATPLGAVTATIRTDDDEIPGLSSLSWEAGALRVLPGGDPDPAYDPDVTAGSLSDLEQPDTVAVSTDERIESGHGLGDRVMVRFGEGAATPMRVVAVFDRGLGFGDYLVGSATVAAHDLSATRDTVLVTTSGSAGEVRLGAGAMSSTAYAHAVTASAPSEQRLSLVLLLALLAFVGLAAADTLVMTTAGRRDELGLLARTGATRRQLVSMAAVESLVVAGVAWAIGTIAVVPAVLAASAGLLGLAVPVVDLTTYAALSASVLAIAVVSIVPTVAWRSRRG